MRTSHPMYKSRPMAMTCAGLAIMLICAMATVKAHAEGDSIMSIKVKEVEAGESITAEEFDEVFDAMRDKEWQKANELTETLITRDTPGQRFLVARMRYIYLYTLLLQFEQNNISIKDLNEKFMAQKGKMLLQPWHTIKSNDKDCMNKICNDPQWKDVVYTTKTNTDRTIVYWYEYVNTSKHLDLSSYNGKIARLGGILKDFSLNEDLMVSTRSDVDWYLRLEIEDGYIQYNR